MTTVTITWNGLLISGTVSHDPGVHTFRNGDPGYPPSTDTEIDTLEIDDADEFSEWCRENDIPAIRWKEHIIQTYGEDISDKLADKFGN